MTHTSTEQPSIEQPSIEAIIHDMRESWARTTHGTWGKGDTTHETVARGGRKKEYKIADFRHADDAQFCDLAHAFTPRLLAEIESLQNRVQELEASQAQRVPQGWRLVPVESTEAMARAFRADDAPGYFCMTTLRCADFSERYAAMLAAAPQPPANEI